MVFVAVLLLLAGCGSNEREVTDSFTLNEEILVETPSSNNLYLNDPFIFAYFAQEVNTTFIVLMMDFISDTTPSRMEQIGFTGQDTGEFSVSGSALSLLHDEGSIFTHHPSLEGVLTITQYGPVNERIRGEFTASVCLQPAIDCGVNSGNVRDFSGEFNVQLDGEDPVVLAN